ncbi:MAG TPA: YlbF family regulator [Candidatus Paceibacterota bacterium]|nr:YlbF family regulator [Verrucomicrobiota bacterium]HSA10511.1 YlbF family regulator [Candidatus Paceibacterota bacterium]
MALTIEETPIDRKTRELCQAILEEPKLKTLRQHIDRFMADETTRAQYDNLVSKGQALQQKQQKSMPLTDEEISDFEQHREAVLNNPVAREFLDAQQELHQVKHAIHQYVSKTLELGRLPSEDELGEGGCNHGSCGCSC